MKFIMWFVIAVALVAFEDRAALTGDWPGHLGPNRNGVAAADEQVSEQIGATPEVRWELPAGNGYSGAAISENQVCLYDQTGEEDRLRLVSLESGTLIWEKRLPTKFRGAMDSDRGPRCVPTLLEKAIVIYSAAGELSLVDRVDGSIKWTRALRKEFQAEDGYFGAGSTPLVVDNQIVVQIGGKSAGVIAVAVKDGKTLWKTGGYDASYSSPIEVKISGQARVLVPTRLKTLLLNPTNGAVLSELGFGSRGPTVNAATPISIDSNKYFLTASYGIGTLVVDLSNDKIAEVLRSGLISSQYATPVFSNGILFCSDGREDGVASDYVGVDTKTMKAIWTQPRMPVCHSILADKKVLVIGIDGRIWAIHENSQKWEPLWLTTLPSGNYRPLPSLSSGTLIVRSVGGNSKWTAIRIDR